MPGSALLAPQKALVYHETKHGCSVSVADGRFLVIVLLIIIVIVPVPVCDYDYDYDHDYEQRTSFPQRELFGGEVGDGDPAR